MLAGNYQVSDILMLVLCIAPVATYFLTLGLVNSHSRPWLISSRADFTSLTIVLIPLLIVPLPALASSRNWWVLIAAAVALVLVFRRMLPSDRAGFVIYNIAEGRCRRLVEDSITRLRWRGRWNGQTWQSSDESMSLTIRSFSPLRNVTLHIEPADSMSRTALEDLRAEIESRFHGVSQMPSTMGACLVMLGLALMIIPMWMVSRHIDDLVDAMSHLFG